MNDTPQCAARLMRSLGMVPDPWQLQVLDCPRSHLLLNCSRQAGKSWYADPSGANERAELSVANFHVVKADNAIAPGLARIVARLEAGALRVVKDRCPNLLREAELYAYSTEPHERQAEVPIDEHNHAISALRYLLSVLDARRMAGRPRVPHRDDAPPALIPPGWRRKSPNQDPDLFDRPEVWTRIF